MAKTRTPPIYTTPQDAALAFYQAFEAKDLDAMMGAWAEDEEIVCVHPGGTRLVGYDAVRSGWEQLFAGDASLTFRLEEIVVIEIGRHRDAERDRAGIAGQRTAAPAATRCATNVFLRTPVGWRLVVHHASPAPATAAPSAPEGPLH